MSGWKTVSLADICEIERGGSPRPISDFVTNDEDGVNWIKITDATASGKCIYATEEKIIPDGVKRSRMVYPGDFILSNSMSFGRPYIMQTSGCIHDGWLVLRKPNADTDFLYYILSSEVVSNQFESLAAGSTVRNLNVQIAKEVKIPLPPLAEQRKIAEILRTWDEAIETAEAEIKAKQERKRVLMKGLFSQKDGRQACDSRPITEIADLSKERPQGAEIVCVDFEHISPETCQLIGSHPVRGDEVSKYRFKNGDVLFAKLRPYLKKAWLSDREGICSSEFWVFRAKTDKGDPGFIRQFVLSEPFLEACAASSGSKMPRADWSHVEKVKFYLPPLSEQSAIAVILQAADAEIETNNKLIMLLRDQKRGLMQKLLTGDVRVAA